VPRTSAVAREVAQPKHYAYIDALRGWAVFAVIFAHGRGAEILPISNLAVTGVQLFYVVSAFSLMLSLDARHRRKSPHLFRDYFIRRFFRISPMFYVAIALYVVIQGFAPRYFAPNGLTWWHIVTTSLFINGWGASHINSVVPGGWSVAVETSFYFLLPLCFIFITTLRRAIIFAISSFFLGGMMSWVCLRLLNPCYPPPQHYILSSFLELWLPNQLCVFAVGIALFFAVQETRGMNLISHSKTQMVWKVMLAAIFMFLISCVLTTVGSAERFKALGYIRHFPTAIGMALISLALSIKPLKLFVNPITAFLGKISYSVYLLHFAVIQLLDWAMEHGYIMGVTGRMFFPAVLVLTCIVSYLTFIFIEQPGQSLGRALICALSRREASVVRNSFGVLVPVKEESP